MSRGDQPVNRLHEGHVARREFMLGVAAGLVGLASCSLESPRRNTDGSRTTDSAPTDARGTADESLRDRGAQEQSPHPETGDGVGQDGRASPDARRSDRGAGRDASRDVGGELYGAEPNPTGQPIGGGSGYNAIISRSDPRVKYLVDTKSELLSALQNARSGDVIYVEGGANINVYPSWDIAVPGGVILASNRGENGALGGRIFCSPAAGADWRGMLRAGGENVRISGLRLEGSDQSTSSPMRAGVYASRRGLEVDNCEISGFGYAGIAFGGTGGNGMKAGGYIHHNNIHNCQNSGVGYGVVVGAGSTCLVEANKFDYCRHEIAGSGCPGDGYEARYNIFGPHKNVPVDQGPQVCDMHGKRESPSSTLVYAGDEIRIHHNTFMCTSPETAWPVVMRGRPRIGCWVDHNWFYFTLDQPVCQNVPYGLTATGNIYVTDNLIGLDKAYRATSPIRYTYWDDSGINTAC